MALRDRFAGLVLAVITVVVVAGCVEAAKPVRLDASIEAAKNLNPDPGGRASPVVVRVYQLRSAGNFENADFFSLYDQEAATLGPDLVSRDELELTPGGSQTIAKDLDPATRYIGVLAAFRDLESARWRDVIAVGDAKSIPLTIKLEGLGVTASVGGH